MSAPQASMYSSMGGNAILLEIQTKHLSPVSTANCLQPWCYLPRDTYQVHLEADPSPHESASFQPALDCSSKFLLQR